MFVLRTAVPDDPALKMQLMQVVTMIGEDEVAKGIAKDDDELADEVDAYHVLKGREKLKLEVILRGLEVGTIPV